MGHALDGARLKVVWAEEQLDILKQKLRTYLDTKPYSIQSVEQDADGRFMLLRRHPPPLPISAQVGACCVSLMSALDYIVWELASKYCGRPLVHPPKGIDKPTFPLFFDASRYKKNVHRLAKYKIPTTALNIIETVQPYHARYEPLGWLYRLTNQDKHRLPLLAVANIDMRGVSGPAPNHPDALRVLDGDSVTIQYFSAQGLPIRFPPGVTRVGKVILEATIDGPPPNVQMNDQDTVFVTLKDVGTPTEPVDRTLEQIAETVADVVPRFDAFFA